MPKLNQLSKEQIVYRIDSLKGNIKDVKVVAQLGTTDWLKKALSQVALL